MPPRPGSEDSILKRRHARTTPLRMRPNAVPEGHYLPPIVRALPLTTRAADSAARSTMLATL